MSSKKKTQPARKRPLSPSDALQKLGEFTTQAIQASNINEPTGSCVYTTSSGTHCAVITKTWCDELQGEWTGGASCP
jgi:hypothetical protein